MIIAFHSTAYAEVNPAFNAVRGKWEMLDSRVENMRCLFDTEAQALAFKEVSLRQLKDREEWQVKETARLETEAKVRADYIASFKGFLSTDPMRAGRQLQTLEKRFNHRGVPRTRKEIVELLLGEGRTVTDNGLEGADGSYLPLGKTERAYASHLVSILTVTANPA